MFAKHRYISTDKQANGPRSNTRCLLTIIPDLISGAKRADHRIRGPDTHTKNDFDEYGGIMTQVNIHTAKTQLSKLIEAALAGEDVVIAKGSQPVVRLVPIPQGSFKLGIMAGTLGTIPDFLEPQDEADLAAWEGAPA
jgi:prevent-host-death family protein